MFLENRSDIFAMETRDLLLFRGLGREGRNYVGLVLLRSHETQKRVNSESISDETRHSDMS